MTVFKALSKAEPIGLRPVINCLFDEAVWLRGRSNTTPDVHIAKVNSTELVGAIHWFINQTKDGAFCTLLIEVTGAKKTIAKILNQTRLVEGDIHARYTFVDSQHIGSVYRYTKCYIVLGSKWPVHGLRVPPDSNRLQSWRRRQMGKETNSVSTRLAELSGDDRHLEIMAALMRWEEISGIPMPEIKSPLWLPWTYGIPFKVKEQSMVHVMNPEMAVRGWGLCLESSYGVTQQRLAI